MPKGRDLDPTEQLRVDYVFLLYLPACSRCSVTEMPKLLSEKVQKDLSEIKYVYNIRFCFVCVLKEVSN